MAISIPQTCVDWVAANPPWAGCWYDASIGRCGGAYESVIALTGWLKQATKQGGQNWTHYADPRSTLVFCFLQK